MIYEITNGCLTAKISNIGAELKSLVLGDTEYIWHGDKAFWQGSSPVLFPICSGLKDNTYYIDGKPYTMEKHGFAKEMLFKAEEVGKDSITFLLTENENTLTCYPFCFELRVTYRIEDSILHVDYTVKNTNAREMFFSIGAHEGYLCPEGIEDYDILLPEKTSLYHSPLNASGTLSPERCPVLENGDKLPLEYRYFEEDALIFCNIDFDTLILKKRNGGRTVRIRFPGFEYLLLWTVPGAPYICVEPWCGITDFENTDQQIENKPGIEALPPGETFIRSHSVEII